MDIPIAPKDICAICKIKIDEDTKYCLVGLAKNYDHSKCGHEYFCSDEHRQQWMGGNWDYFA